MFPTACKLCVKYCIMVRLSLTLANPGSKSEPKSNPDANNITNPDLYPQDQLWAKPNLKHNDQRIVPLTLIVALTLTKPYHEHVHNLNPMIRFS